MRRPEMRRRRRRFARLGFGSGRACGRRTGMPVAQGLGCPSTPGELERRGGNRVGRAASEPHMSKAVKALSNFSDSLGLCARRPCQAAGGGHPRLSLFDVSCRRPGPGGHESVGPRAGGFASCVPP